MDMNFTEVTNKLCEELNDIYKIWVIDREKINSIYIRDLISSLHIDEKIKLGESQEYVVACDIIDEYTDLNDYLKNYDNLHICVYPKSMVFNSREKVKDMIDYLIM